MTRKSYIQGPDGKLYDKSELTHQEHTLHTVQGDLPDFISPIDGSVVSGRAGLREHCRKHDVVPTEELKGLPPKPFQNTAVDPHHREQTRQTIADVINSRGYFRR